MEVFSFFIKRVMDGGFMSGYRVKGKSEEGVQISHLLFVDEMPSFSRPSDLPKLVAYVV